MTLDDFTALVKKRRSIRYFKNDPVPEALIRNLLDIAHLSPSVGNTQPWRFHVIRSKELMEKLMETSCYGNFVAGAGSFIVVTCDTTAEAPSQDPLWNPKELEYSCMSAMTHMLLGATAAGLGSCWVSMHHGPSHEILDLPRHEIVMGGIMIGFYRPGEEEGGEHHQRRPIDSVMTFHE